MLKSLLSNDNRDAERAAANKRKAAQAEPHLLYGLLALALFLCLKLSEIYTVDLLSVWEMIALQSLQCGFLMLFAIFWYDVATARWHFRSLEANEQRKAQGKAASGKQPASAIAANSWEARGTLKSVPAITQELIQSMKPLLENLRAIDHSQARMPQKDPQRNSLHSLSSQSQRISQIIKHLESHLQQQNAGIASAAKEGGYQWIRQAPRTISVNPLTVRGQDFHRNWFETLSYTLNASPYGACLILPEQPLQVGQTLSIYDQHLGTQASVRWLANGKKGGMVVAGVKFAKPLPSLLPLPSPSTASSAAGNY